MPFQPKPPTWKLTTDQQKVVEANLGLVYRMLFMRGYLKDHPHFEEVESLAVEALMRAARGFKPERGFTFSTYACRCILKELARWYARNAKHEAHHRRHWIQVQAGWLGARKDEALNEREREDASRAIKDQITRHVRWLTDRERQIIQLRFWKGLTLNQVGIKLGVCRQAVQQTEARVLDRMRKEWE